MVGLDLIIKMILIGVAVWLVGLIPVIDATFKKIIQGGIILFTVIWLLKMFWPA